MGSWVSASFGYGIVLPGEDDDYEPSEWVKQFATLNAEPWYWDIDWYEVAEAISKEHRLTFEMGYVNDYSGGGALFSGEVVTSFDTVKTFNEFPIGHSYSDLHAAATKLGLRFDPKWILVASYG